jgi:hypothetical protein
MPRRPRTRGKEWDPRCTGRGPARAPSSAITRPPQSPSTQRASISGTRLVPSRSSPRSEMLWRPPSGGLSLSSSPSSRRLRRPCRPNPRRRAASSPVSSVASWQGTSQDTCTRAFAASGGGAWPLHRGGARHGRSRARREVGSAQGASRIVSGLTYDAGALLGRHLQVPVHPHPFGARNSRRRRLGWETEGDG